MDDKKRKRAVNRIVADTMSNLEETTTAYDKDTYRMVLQEVISECESALAELDKDVSEE